MDGFFVPGGQYGAGTGFFVGIAVGGGAAITRTVGVPVAIVGAADEVGDKVGVAIAVGDVDGSVERVGCVDGASVMAMICVVGCPVALEDGAGDLVGENVDPVVVGETLAELGRGTEHLMGG